VEGGEPVATTVTLDTDLLDDVVAATGENTKASAVRKALLEYLRLRRLRELSELAGQVPMEYANEEIEGMEDA